VGAADVVGGNRETRLEGAPLAAARADPAGRHPPRRLTGQAKRGRRPRGPGPSLVTGAPSAHRQVPQRPSGGSARRNAPHALPARSLAPPQRRRAASASDVRARQAAAAVAAPAAASSAARTRVPASRQAQHAAWAAWRSHPAPMRQADRSLSPTRPHRAASRPQGTDSIFILPLRGGARAATCRPGPAGARRPLPRRYAPRLICAKEVARFTNRRGPAAPPGRATPGLPRAAGPGEAAGAHVAREFGGQNGPGRPHPTRGLPPHAGRFGGAFLSTRPGEVLPALTGHLGAHPRPAGLDGPPGRRPTGCSSPRCPTRRTRRRAATSAMICPVWPLTSATRPTPERTSSPNWSVGRAPADTAPCVSRTLLSTSRVATAAWPAGRRASRATTTKPRPCSPAFSASPAASVDGRSVRPATWVVVVTTWVMLSAFSRVAASSEEIEPADSTGCRVARPVPPAVRGRRRPGRVGGVAAGQRAQGGRRRRRRW
jgi:hypothetical protein